MSQDASAANASSVSSLAPPLPASYFQYDYSQGISIFFAAPTAVIDAYFAQFFAEDFAHALGISATHFSRYAAVMTGITSFALSRASLLRALGTLKQLNQQRKVGLPISKIYPVFFLVSILGAIPSWQFAQDTAKTWPSLWAFLFKLVQFINTSAINCRPLLETFNDSLLSEKNRQMALELRRILLSEHRTADISEEDFSRLCDGKLTKASPYPRYKKGIKLFMLLAAPAYAVSYYFATQLALRTWHKAVSILISFVAFALKTAFICRTGFNLVDKIFVNKPILLKPNSIVLPRALQVSLSVVSVGAGLTTASASAGTLLKYLLPQVGFLGSEKSLNGLLVALAISICANSFSKIYDIDTLLRGLFVQAFACYRKAPTSTEPENNQRLMQYASSSLTALLIEHTQLSPKGDDRVSNYAFAA